VSDHKSRDGRYTIAVDFDGVIHSYTTPWIDAVTIPDPPVKGAIPWLNSISEKFNVVIFTTRAKTFEGAAAVANWLADRGHIPYLVTAEKPAALIYLDDRAYRFDGSNFPTADEIHRARPWNKGRASA
jgi:hypothetical protein